jgi:UDPglucose 6-dehydrogenase
MPGTTRDVVKPILERESERKCGSDLLLAYSPEFIALGTVIRDFLEPDWVLLGEDSPAAGDWLEEFYKKVCKNNPPVQRMSAINAEIAKLSLNCYVTTKISFANSLAAICEQVPGGDAQTILKAIGLDKRIGQKAILPGLGFGGPCFPRDNLAFQTFAKDAGACAPLAEAVQAINETQPERVVKLIQSQIDRGSVVAILGAAYKPMTDIIEDAQPVLIARLLVGRGYRVRVFDPMAKARLDAELGTSVEIVSSMEDCVSAAAACLIGLPWDANRDPAPLLGKMSPPRLVIDPWHTDRLRPAGKEWRYYSIGRDATSSRNAK